MPDSFSKKLARAFAERGPLCVGIDPHSALLEEAGLAADVSGLEAFALNLLDQITDVVSIIKPQVSFFERFGSAGFAVLEKLLSEAAQRDLLVIADAKRGDIGSTMDAYTGAWLSKSAPFICDALTLSPFLGFETLHGAIATASERGKAVFVLCSTSNPEGRQIQAAIDEGKTIAEQISAKAIVLNQISAQSESKYGTVGLVIGATGNNTKVLDQLANQRGSLRAPILAPGFGTQGAELSQLKRIFGEVSQDVICNASRDILSDGLINAGKRAIHAQEILNSALAS